MKNESDLLPESVTHEEPVYSLSQLAGAINSALSDLGSGWVEAEVQKLTVAQSGHRYIDIADEDELKMSVIVWKGRWSNIGYEPEDGDLAELHFTKIDYYAPYGKLSLHVDNIRQVGVGELVRRKKEILERLESDGLTDESRKLPLPRFPRRIGLISGKDSDAKQDVIKAIQDRWPPAEILFHPSVVEGVNAPGSIIDAIGRLQDQRDVDVIVIARGGGNITSLYVFDDERLCRAIFACAKPVVTAIGHTKQRPNCDLVADACSDVPGKTAELVVPSVREMKDELTIARRELDVIYEIVLSLEKELDNHAAQLRPTRRLRELATEIDVCSEKLSSISTKFFDGTASELSIMNTQITASFKHALLRLVQLDKECVDLAAHIKKSASVSLDKYVRRLELKQGILLANDYRAHGYMLVHRDGHRLRSIHDFKAGDDVELSAEGGSASASIKDIKHEKNEAEYKGGYTVG